MHHGTQVFPSTKGEGEHLALVLSVNCCRIKHSNCSPLLMAHCLVVYFAVVVFYVFFVKSVMSDRITKRHLVLNSLLSGLNNHRGHKWETVLKVEHDGTQFSSAVNQIIHSPREKNHYLHNLHFFTVKGHYWKAWRLTSISGASWLIWLTQSSRRSRLMRRPAGNQFRSNPRWRRRIVEVSLFC